MKTIAALFFVFFFSTFQYISLAQVGADCTTPHVITSLPFSQTGLTTAGSGNDFDETDACASNYMTGEDYVFTYTPATNQTVEIILSNTGMGVGLFVLDDCPDQSAACIDMAEAALGNPTLPQVVLTSGTTYYIVVSTYDSFIPNPSTAFDIAINELVTEDVGILEILAPFSNCSLSASENVTVVIMNFGINAISNFDVVFEVNSTVIATENVSSLISAESTLEYTFTQTADLSSIGTTYTITAYTQFAGDENAANDEAEKQVTNTEILATFPYEEDF
ncbi:MAG: hypothetical protein KJ607_00555 [Bacteroidetes bacterium]|nr:hypothetical protein [Bacteroidota bacterium]